ncbi:MAG: alpha/beta hydrolase [Microthrixaceae bacterium]|nr:alpha/beta hydrolase [Microthrixaceae bacterium]
MGWLYLIVSINGAAYTVNARRPMSRSRYSLGWSFFASWVTIELAPFHIIWQVIATAVFVRKGVLRSSPGRLGFAISMASLVGLLVTVRQAFASRHEVREALRGLRDQPLPAKYHEVRWERHIVFARAGGRNLTMDVVRPVDPPAPGARRPVMVQVHGGGWVLGFKQHQGQLLMLEMARAGWVCANVDYRLSPAATFPDHLVDVKRAIAWIRENAGAFRGRPRLRRRHRWLGGRSPDRIDRADAERPHLPDRLRRRRHLGAGSGAVLRRLRLHRSPGNVAARHRRVVHRPVGDEDRPEEDPEGWAAASPIDCVNADAPPMMIVHGDLDLLAPVEDARLFVERLQDVSRAPVYYLELTGAQHAFEVFPPSGPTP